MKSRAKGPKSGCPVCSGRSPCVCRSLAALAPDIGAQWDPVRNEGLGPEKVTLGSNRVVWWLCKEHDQPHSWTTDVKARTHPRRPSGCPMCAKEQRTEKGQTKRTLPSAALACLHFQT